MRLTGHAKLAGVMGWPVGHSRSPRLHGYWLEHYGIDGAYLPLAVPPEGLKAALQALPLLGFRGCNVTVPHKERAFTLVDECEPSARAVGAVNTVVVTADGRLHGSNTDGFGFLSNLDQEAPGWDQTEGPTVVLGAGGAARAVVAALAGRRKQSLVLTNRSAERAHQLVRDLGLTATVMPWAERDRLLAVAAVVVNTTSLGMVGQPPLDLDLSHLPPSAVVTDLVYAPLETPLLAAARARGARVVDGLGMLLHQARPGFEAWFGQAPAVTPALRQAVLGD